MNNTLSILQTNLGKYKKTSSGEYLFKCPKCHHPKNKFQININTDLYHCWHCSLAFRSTYNFLKKFFPSALPLLPKKKEKYNVVLEQQFEEEFGIEETTVVLPNDVEQLKHIVYKKHISLKHKSIIKYLHNRGIQNRQIEKYDIGVINGGRNTTLIFPSYDSKDELNYYVTKIFYKKDGKSITRYMYPKINRSKIIPLESTINWNHSITLTEGIFDAMKINHNSIPLLGCSLNKHWNLFQKILSYNSKIFMCLDNDTAGITGTVKISKLFLEYNKDIFYIDISPYKDVGEMTKKEFLLRKRDAVKIDEFFILEKQLEIS